MSTEELFEKLKKHERKVEKLESNLKGTLAVLSREQLLDKVKKKNSCKECLSTFEGSTIKNNLDKFFSARDCLLLCPVCNEPFSLNSKIYLQTINKINEIKEEVKLLKKEISLILKNQVKEIIVTARNVTGDFTDEEMVHTTVENRGESILVSINDLRNTEYFCHGSYGPEKTKDKQELLSILRNTTLKVLNGMKVMNVSIQGHEKCYYSLHIEVR